MNSILSISAKNWKFRQKLVVITFIPDYSWLEDGNGLGVVVFEDGVEDDRGASEFDHVI